MDQAESSGPWNLIAADCLFGRAGVLDLHAQGIGGCILIANGIFV